MGAALCCLVLPRLEAAKLTPQQTLLMMMTRYEEGIGACVANATLSHCRCC